MLTEKEKLVVLLSLYDVSNKKQERIFEKFEDVESVSKVVGSDDFQSELSSAEIEKIVGEFDENKFNNIVSNIENAGIRVLTVFSKDYPNSLIDLPDRPMILYAKGDLSLIEKDTLAVVGTRVPSNYGKVVVEKFVGKLAESGFVIVSGLCYGVDEIAHKKTLEVGGKTIAVVGSGFNKIYPAINAHLANEIAEKGLLLSEYPPSYIAKKYTFPRRNRIVAGLSNGVLIPEAGLKSGTVYTKDFALEYGKDVFAVPGSILNPKSELPNQLIKTAQAECVVDADDIIKYYGKEFSKEKKTVSVTFDEQAILDLLADGEKVFDYLSEKSQIPVKTLNGCLTTLEIRGLIKKLPAQTYAII